MRLPGFVAFSLLALSAPLSALMYTPTPAEARATHVCGSETYVNSRGHCVRRPVKSNRPPAGATAKCRDGTYSFSESHRGTCSWHGGVASWL